MTILLPRAATIARTDETAVVESGGNGTVLLVEDNPDVASVSMSLLEQLGYKVHRVADAEAALRELEHDGVDLLFSDIVMPGNMDGIGLARSVRKMHPNMPILLATGYADVPVSSP